MNKNHKIDGVRASFLEGLSRICLALGLGHFLCIPPLVWLFGTSLTAPSYTHYITTLVTSGCVLTAVAFLCRFRRMRPALSYFCLALLFFQTVYYLYREGDVFHPIVMLLPIITSLATPILGRGASWVVAGASALVLGLFFFGFHLPASQIPALILLTLALVFPAYLTELLWNGMIQRERALQKKTQEMEAWVERLGQASSRISSGQLSAALPESPPSEVFRELTRSMEQMQEQLNQYFSNLRLKDRLTSLGVLASGVAHELNTPLTTMQFVLQGDETIPEETKKILLEEIARVTGIAKSLLNFARPTDEQIVDIVEVVRSSEGLLKWSGRGQVAFHLDLPVDTLLVRGMTSQIQQVLLNLFHNAMDAT